MIAPALYRLAFRKKLTVRVALNSGTWMRGLQRMSSVRELDQFITLWTRIQEVTLTNEPDSVMVSTQLVRLTKFISLPASSYQSWSEL